MDPAGSESFLDIVWPLKKICYQIPVGSKTLIIIQILNFFLTFFLIFDES
jgi:hypothetical protein